MSLFKLIADSGATKAEWCLLNNGKKKTIFTAGISPYFLNTQEIAELLKRELYPKVSVTKLMKCITMAPVVWIQEMHDQ